MGVHQSHHTRARFFLLQLCILSNATCYSLPRGFTDILRLGNSYGSHRDKSSNFNETRRSDDNGSLWRTNLTRSIRQSRLVIKKAFRGNLIISFTCNCSVYLKSRHSRKKIGLRPTFARQRQLRQRLATMSMHLYTFARFNYGWKCLQCRF